MAGLHTALPIHISYRKQALPKAQKQVAKHLLHGTVLGGYPKSRKPGRSAGFSPTHHIDTRGAYQDDESDEDLPPTERSCYREKDEDEEEDEEGDQTFEVFHPANYFQSEKK